MNRKKGFIYNDRFTNEISFPLGGIGAGSIGLAGNGRLVDFEIFNKPNKNSVNGLTFIAVKAEDENKVLDTRALNGDLHAPYMGENNENRGFGFGVNRATMAGCPHFEGFSFNGAFPIANVNFCDSNFPGQVELTAFNPFIPQNDKDSSLPAAFFEVEFHNTTDKQLTYTAAFSLTNPAKGDNMHIEETNGGARNICLGNSKYAADTPDYGNMCIATDCADTSVQSYWYRGQWFDSLSVFWKDFSSFGKLGDRSYTEQSEKADIATLTGTITLPPKQSGKVRFIVSWYYPNVMNYWRKEQCDCNGECNPTIWKNYYASLFGSSKACAAYCIENYERLKAQTELFKDALFSSTLPDCVLDAVSANISILKSTTCLRLEEGSFYGFEGCIGNAGCCEGSCTHVWNYAYALPFLFPALERSMRELDYKYNMDQDGGMSFRLQLPLGRERRSMRPCADGQFGGIVKVYREWKICGDDNWLKSMWPYIKKNLEYAWSPNNKDKWDIDKTGVLQGRQHHTLDMELFGPNSWLTGFYLAALKAAAEMADHLNDSDAHIEYSELFKKGKAWVEENLFNGRFYYQKIDVKDQSVLDGYEDAERYWNSEAEEIKYQIAEGSSIDQVLAQWHANICGLGEIYNGENVKQSLKTIYAYNYKKSMRNYFNPCRIYCLNDESGTVICDWPDKTKKPIIPVPYSEETFHGNEYQVAIHMLQEGMIEEGVELIKAVRDRYDGYRRNPWNEFECGSNYARSMASYAAILAFSGFKFDMPKQKIGFNPITKGDFKCFWSIDCGWGIFEKSNNKASITVLYGSLKISRLDLKFIVPKNILINEKNIGFKVVNEEIIFDDSILINTGETIEINGEIA